MTVVIRKAILLYVIMLFVLFESIIFAARITVHDLNSKALMLVEALNDGRFDYATNYLESLKIERKETTDGYSAYDVAVGSLSLLLEKEQLLLWRENTPNSSIPFTVSGQKAVELAWAERGTGWSSSVPEENWEGFYKYLDLAENYLIKAHSIDSYDYVACSNMIVVNMGKCNKLGCYDWFQRAAHIFPEYYTAYHALAYALYPRWLGTASEVNKFISSVDFSDPKFNRIKTNWLKNEEDILDPKSETSVEVRKLLNAYSEAYPKSGLAHRTIAELAWKQGRKKMAVKFAKKAVETDPQNKNLYALAWYLNEMRRYEESMPYVLQSIEQGSTNHRIFMLAGENLQFGFKNYYESIPYYSEALNRIDGSKYIFRKRGDCYFHINEYDKALSDYQSALNIDPNHDQALFGIGRTYHALGDVEKAKEAFDKVVLLQPRWEKQINRILSSKSPQ